MPAREYAVDFGIIIGRCCSSPLYIVHTAQQVACFRNAAAHLRPGGRFVIEVAVPQLHQLPPGQTIRPFAWTNDYLGFDEYVDRDGQILVSRHFRFDGDQVTRISGAFRYGGPSALDLTAQPAQTDP